MTPFSNSPHLFKGALVPLKPSGAPDRAIVFQYNPDTLTRTLTARMLGGEADKGDVLRFKGPPEESIKLDVEIDAADQLEKAEAKVVSMGLHPALAALEALLYPDSQQILDNDKLLSAGNKEIIPPEAPLTLLVWGPNRILPVKIGSLSITEEAFDPDLNPIRAKVSLDLKVLSYQELGLKSVGGSIYMSYQKAKEALARSGPGHPLFLNWLSHRLKLPSGD